MRKLSVRKVRDRKYWRYMDFLISRKRDPLLICTIMRNKGYYTVMRDVLQYVDNPFLLQQEIEELYKKMKNYDMMPEPELRLLAMDRNILDFGTMPRSQLIKCLKGLDEMKKVEKKKVGKKSTIRKTKNDTVAETESNKSANVKTEKDVKEKSMKPKKITIVESKSVSKTSSVKNPFREGSTRYKACELIASFGKKNITRKEVVEIVKKAGMPHPENMAAFLARNVPQLNIGG